MLDTGALFRAFFARQTVFIFIAHVPLLFALQPLLHNMIPSYWPRIGHLMLILYPGLAIISEAVMQVLQPTKLRDAFWILLNSFANNAGPASLTRKF